MNIDISLIVPLGGIVALLFAAFLFYSVKKQSAGNEKMQELSNAIRKGAMAFLKSEYKVLVIFVIVVAALLFIASFKVSLRLKVGMMTLTRVMTTGER